jgi:MFS family permease
VDDPGRSGPSSRAAARTALLLGIGQTLAWATSFYLPAVLAPAVARDLGASPVAVQGAFSLALLIAGLAAPRTGRAIERQGGRGVLMLSSVVLAAGLALLGTLPGLAGWFLGWIVLGLGMALGLYEAAFATLGMLYGRAARRPITLVTLFAGFASTVGWPMSALLLAEIGWRGTCLAYAGIHLAVVLPLYGMLPRAGGLTRPPPASPPSRRRGAARRRPRRIRPGRAGPSGCWPPSSPSGRSSAPPSRCMSWPCCRGSGSPPLPPSGSRR